MENAVTLSDSVEKLTLTGDEAIIAVDGRNVKIPLSVVKEYLGTVQEIVPRPIKPSDPAPMFDGVYKPKISGTYDELGGIVVDFAGVDKGKDVSIIRNEGSFVKFAVELPMVPLNNSGTSNSITEAATANSVKRINDKLSTYSPYIKGGVDWITGSDSTLWLDKDVILKSGDNKYDYVFNYFRADSKRLFIAFLTIDSSNNYSVISRHEIISGTGWIKLNVGDFFTGDTFTQNTYIGVYDVGGDRVATLRAKPSHYVYASDTPFAANGTLSALNNFELSCYLEVINGVESLSERVSILESGGLPKPEKLSLPDYVDTYIGATIQIFKPSLLNVIDYKNYYIKVTTDKSIGISKAGKDYLRFWEYTAIDASVFNAVFELYNNYGDVVESKTVTIRSKAKPASLTLKNAIFIGDSLTYYGRIPDEFYRLITTNVANITQADTLSPQTVNRSRGVGLTGLTLKGTQKQDFKGWPSQQFNEGWSGLTALDLMSSGSPFYIGGTYNFSQYLSNNSIGAVDSIFLGLGWNDIVKSPESTWKTNLKALINGMKSALPSVKVFLWSENMPSTLGGIGEHPYGSDSRVNLAKWREDMSKFKAILLEISKELNNVIYVDASAQFDSETGMQYQMSPRNKKVTQTVIQGVDDVHPNDSGFFQIADSLAQSFIYHQ